MSFGWQTIVTLMLVAAAATFVLRKLWNAVLSKSGSSCGACGSCAAPKKDLVTIDLVKRP